MIKPSPLRFTRKLYGRGRTPRTRQGRTITTIYILIILAGALMGPSSGQLSSPTETLILSIWFVVPTICFVWICYYTGPTPKRQRGSKSDDNDD